MSANLRHKNMAALSSYSLFVFSKCLDEIEERAFCRLPIECTR